jgi:hypothetical protein
MDQSKTALERAFEIARFGRPRGVSDIRARLKDEGYDEGQILGRGLKRQLLQIIKKARADETNIKPRGSLLE